MLDPLARDLHLHRPWAPRYKDELVKEKTRLEVAVKNLGTGTNFLWACLSFLLSFILVKSPWKTFLIQPNFIFYYLFSSGWKNEIIFCITNEISFTIISLSSSDKFFLKSWFSSWNYYYITNYHWNLLRFTLYIRS